MARVTVPRPDLQIDEFWEDLLAFIDERQVIPVVGPELLEVGEEGHRVPLYRAVAERLVRRYGLQPASDTEASDINADVVLLRPQHDLNDAVCALARRGRRVQDLYRPINDALRAVLAEQRMATPPQLVELASIRHFDLFVSTTCDDLLTRAINASRFNGDTQTDSIQYAPNLSSDKVGDIPEFKSTEYTAVFHMFGKASASPQFAIHDEDVLEFVYSLLVGRGYVPERMFGAIRARSLLLIGCNFSDWLSRFFIRIANTSRLFGDRAKKEFVVDAAASTDGSLTLFLERFSQNTRMFPGTSAEFVAALTERWAERHPDAGRRADLVSTLSTSRRASAFFVSYSSTDRPAAERLVEAIKDVGGDVVWFDRRDLTPGDDWRVRIVDAIQRCRIFLPLISVNTDTRDEGFFRKEWKEACERAAAIEGRKFIVPIVIDEDYSGDATRYALVPESFRKYQFAHAPRGLPSPQLRAELVAEIRAPRRTESP